MRFKELHLTKQGLRKLKAKEAKTDSYLREVVPSYTNASHASTTSLFMSLFNSATTTNIRSVTPSPSSLSLSLKISYISKLFIKGMAFLFLI